MWGRCRCSGVGVFGSLRKRVSSIVNLCDGYGKKLGPFDPYLLGLKGVVVGGVERRELVSLSIVVLNQIKNRGLSSSKFVITSNQRLYSNNSSKNSCGDGNGDATASKGNGTEEFISYSEAKKLLRLVNVETLKMRLGMEGKEVIPYTELLEACESIGIARSEEEAIAFSKVLDEAGVILLFRDKVYLHPDKVVDLVLRVVPLPLTADDDPIWEEIKKLQEKKEEIDILAYKQVRRILWSGLGFSVVIVGLFFRLTFWEFSWDVTGPIAYFITTIGLVLGYAYFLFTSRNPTYQDLMKRLFLSRQRKLFKRHNFDVERFRELQNKCRAPLYANTVLRNHMGVHLDLDNAIHRD
ncbi:hypothetical protein PIB30_005179 [Stylosanthes scabra]|uniref:Calcium uniporter protein C-terminal domain-containing protein n=1 Tax=Stylosanthes scabra TaxID=79078 RepID=A0ABU6R520_9FABA|nr:hypothetical protein [Stylosanthes scabra]